MRDGKALSKFEFSGRIFVLPNSLINQNYLLEVRMIEDRFRISGELFKRILLHMDSLSRKELVEIQAESRAARADDCSPALYHVILALDDLAKVELINRNLMNDT